MNIKMKKKKNKFLFKNIKIFNSIYINHLYKINMKYI